MKSATKHKSKKKRISVSSAKAKGMELQKDVAKALSVWTGFECGTSHDGDLPIQPRPSGQSGSDIRLESQVVDYITTATNGIFTGKAIECKRQEKWSIPEWIEQARKYSNDGKDWWLFARKNNRRAIVVLDAESFFELLELLSLYTND